MDWYFKSNPLIRILIGLVLGVVVGLIVGPPIAVIKPLGNLLIRLLLMIVVPVVLFSLIVGSARITPAKLGRVFVKVLVIYLGTGVIAVLIGLLWANVFKPGVGFQLAGAAPAREGVAAVLRVCEGVAEIMYKIVGGVLQYAPIGVFALIAIVFGQQGAKAFGPLGMVTLTVYIGLATHLVFVYGGLLTIWKINFFKFLGKAKEPMLTASTVNMDGTAL